jgi:hypothetical protein
VLDRQASKGRTHLAKIGPGFVYVHPFGSKPTRLLWTGQTWLDHWARHAYAYSSPGRHDHSGRRGHIKERATKSRQSDVIGNPHTPASASSSPQSHATLRMGRIFRSANSCTRSTSRAKSNPLASVGSLAVRRTTLRGVERCEDSAGFVPFTGWLCEVVAIAFQYS